MTQMNMTLPGRPLLIHVAAESEGRGRVLLASRSAQPHAAALAATFTLARAFDTWVEALHIECPDVVALTAHEFARGVSHSGRIARLSQDEVRAAQVAETSLARGVVTEVAGRSGVRLVSTVARDGLADALAKACAIEGPWNIVALAEPVACNDGAFVRALLDGLAGATGIVCVGPDADATPAGGGAVVVVVEDLDRLSQKLRVAERLATAAGAKARPIEMVVAAGSAEQTTELEGHLRLLLADIPQAAVPTVRIAAGNVLHGTSHEVAEAVRRLSPGFVIARGGGSAVPLEARTQSLLDVVACPVLLVR